MRMIVHLRHSGTTHTTVDFGDVVVAEDFNLEAFFAGANGMGPYKGIRNVLPRSFSMGDVVYFDIPLTDPTTGRQYHYHICRAVGWYSCTEEEFTS